MKRLAILLGTVTAAAALSLMGLIPASADDGSTTTFSSGATQTVGFGSNWLMTIKVSAPADYGVLPPSPGTVNILVKGQPGNYATGLPVTPGGLAFFAPPSSKPPLPAGSYSVTAVFVPASGSSLTASQTITPGSLTITPVAISTSFTVKTVTANQHPALQVAANLATTGLGAGTLTGKWTFTAKNAAGATVYATDLPLADKPGQAVTATLGPKVVPGNTYRVSATFVPDSTVAGGYKVTNAPEKTVLLPAESALTVLATPFSVPTWALIAIGVGLALLIATLVVLLMTRRKTTTPVAAPVDAA